MKYLPFLLLSLGLAAGAIYLAVNDKEGWGWFLFGAIITFVYPSGKKNKED